LILGLPAFEIYIAYIEGLAKTEKDKNIMDDIHAKLLKLNE